MLRQLAGRKMCWVGETMLRMAKVDHLNSIDPIPLRCDIQTVVDVYGQPLEIEQSDDFPEATKYSFRASAFHECQVWEWEGLVQAIAYFPECSFPAEDLSFMMDTYGENNTWEAVNQGYLYYRDDLLVRLWCSALPPLGVATMEFWKAKERYSGD